MSRIPHKKKEGGLHHVIHACVASSLILPTYVLAQDDETVEEIIVTGSYIRRDNYDQPSPLKLISLQDIEEAGTISVGDLLFDLNAMSGVDPGDRSPFTFGNLRGLGAGATMELMDGHRLLFGDANNTYPQIAIQQVEVLLDGASALYGSEAVAGVVNYVPRKRMDGIEFRINHKVIEDISDAPDTNYSLIGGWSSDDSSFVFAYEYRERNEIKQTDDKFEDYLLSRANRRDPNSAGRLNSSGPWEDSNWPGTFDVPRRNTDGSARSGTSTMADPACQFSFNNGGEDITEQGSYKNGILASNGKCEQNNFSFRNYVDDLTYHKAYAHFEHEFSENLSMHAQFVFGVQDATGRNGPVGSNSSSRIGNNLQGDRYLVSGTHPGNPYRAMAGGQPLYAQDANADGIPDRDGSTTSYNAKHGGNVILAANPFDVNSGIPFNEDVYLDDKFSVVGALSNPLGGRSRYIDDDGASQSFQHTQTQRYQLGFEYTVPDTEWIINADYILANRDRDRKDTFGNSHESLSAIERGLNCQLGETGDKCFNPFATSVYQHDELGNPMPFFQDDPALINDQEVYDRLLAPANQENIYEQNIFDIVAAGPLPLELQGGPLQLAVGGHYRLEQEEFLPDRLALLEDRTRGSTFKRRVTESASLDWFAEVVAPVLDSDRWGTLELSAAVRYTDNEISATIPEESGSGSYDDTILKFAALYQPVEWVAFRASYGEGFVIPDQFSAFGDKRITQEQTGFSTGDYTCEVLVDDDSTGDGGLGGTAVTGVTQADCSTGRFDYRRTTVATPGLQGETSEAYNVGISFNLFDGRLSIDIDRFEVDFIEQVVFAGVDVQMDGYRAGFQDFMRNAGCANGDAACNLAARANYIATVEPGLANFTLASVGGAATSAGPTSLGIFRTGTESSNPLAITEVVSSRINADESKSVSYDISTRFTFDAEEIPLIGGDYGSFTANLDVTFLDEYTITPNPAIPEQVINLAGQYGRNEGLQDGGAPRWKGSAGLRWSMGNHTARLTGRYHHHLEDLENSGACVSTLSNASCRIDAMAVFDMYYQYRVQDFFGIGGETTLALTVNNIGDRNPDPQETAVTPYASSLDRIWGRYYNFRVSHSF